MRTFETPEPISIDIDLGLGSIRILASDRADTTVDIHPRDEDNAADVNAVTQARVEFAAGTLSVHAQKTWRRFTPINDGAIDVTVEVPTGSHVTGSTDLGDFYSDGQLGQCSFRSAMGRLRLEEAHSVALHTSFGEAVVDQCTGDAEVTTSSGRIRIRRIGGTGFVKNSNGDTWIGEAGGTLRIKAANGDITVDRALASLTAKTAAGSIRIGEVVAGNVELRSSAGDLEIGVRDGSAAWLDLGSKNGRVRNTLTAGEPPDQADHVVEIRATTSYGDVVVDRVPAPAPLDDEPTEWREESS